MLLTRDYFMGLQLSHVDLRAWCAQHLKLGFFARRRVDPVQLFWEIVEKNAPSAGVKAALNIAYGVADFDPRRVINRAGCECLQCAGHQSDPDPDCLLATVDVVDRVMAAHDPELLAHYWDRPYYIYVLALHRQQCEWQRIKKAEYLAAEELGNETEQASAAAMQRLIGGFRG